MNRILHRGLWRRKTWVRGGGAYFSFTRRSNDYDEEPDLQLAQGALSSGFAGGDVGAVIAVPVSQGLKAFDPEKHLPDLLQAETAAEFKDRLRAAKRAGTYRDPAAKVGQVYVMRSVRWGESDVIVAFHVVDEDRNGITFVWKLLETRVVPRR